VTDRGPDPDEVPSEPETPGRSDPDGIAGDEAELPGDQLEGLQDPDVVGGDDAEADDLIEADMIEPIGSEVDGSSAPIGAGTAVAAASARTTLRPGSTEGRAKLEIDDPVSKWWVVLIAVVFVAIFGWALLFGQGGLLGGLLPEAPSPSPAASVLPSLSASPLATTTPGAPSPSASVTATATPTPRPTATPTPQPTASPTPRPTATPTPSPSPTPEPTPPPTLAPTPEPSPVVTSPPSPSPSAGSSPSAPADTPLPSLASPAT
jgi:hypothetical protein